MIHGSRGSRLWRLCGDLITITLLAESFVAIGEAKIERNAMSVKEMKNIGKFHFAIWQRNLETALNELPISGNVAEDHQPKSGSYYPEISGGTDINTPDSALDKYDKAFNGGKDLASSWERTNHTRSESDENASWAGHCNGFAASSQRHKEPQKDVIREGVTFTRQDIKALLAEIYMSAKSVFLGGSRCQQVSPINSPDERDDVTKMDACEDVNPASFHIALANWVGVERHTVIFDTSTKNEVWNFPLFSYESEILKNITVTQALTYLGLSGTEYVYNPRAVSFAFVKTTVSYANAFTTETLDKQAIKTKDYSYILELDADDRIVGGEWSKENRINHPDFIWVSLEAMSGDGNRSLANPHIESEHVISLWAESIGADPKNPPSDIVEPVWQTTWGRFPDFEIELDGRQTGAVFLGSPIRLRVKRKSKLQGAVTLAIALNDKVIKTVNAKGASDIVYEFESSAGLNKLGFVWIKAGVEVDRSFLRFDAMP